MQGAGHGHGKAGEARKGSAILGHNEVLHPLFPAPPPEAEGLISPCKAVSLSPLRKAFICSFNCGALAKYQRERMVKQKPSPETCELPEGGGGH